jgi:membrane-associated phospholipid phosphatase
MRLEEASATIWEAFPPELLDLAEVVTDVGGPAGSVFVLAVVYWLADRERAATVVAYALVGAGIVTTVKFALALPRPPDPAIAADGYGFPSGHAFTATVVYGGLLMAFDRVRDPRAVGAVAAVVTVISLTRVFLRVHYLGDVLAGAALGLGFLVVIHRLVDDLRAGFGLAVVTALVAAAASEGAEPSLVALGLAIGAFGASFAFDTVPERQSRAESALLVACGVTYLLLVVALDAVVVGATEGVVAGTLTVLFQVALALGIFFAPVVVRRLDRGRQRWLSAGQRA